MTFARRVSTPSVCARCSSAPMPASASPKRLRLTSSAVAIAAPAIASTVRYTVSFEGTTVSTRPTVPETCFSTKVTAWRISSVMPKVSTAK